MTQEKKIFAPEIRTYGNDLSKRWRIEWQVPAPGGYSRRCPKPIYSNINKGKTVAERLALAEVTIAGLRFDLPKEDGLLLRCTFHEHSAIKRLSQKQNEPGTRIIRGCLGLLRQPLYCKGNSENLNGAFRPNYLLFGDRKLLWFLLAAKTLQRIQAMPLSTPCLPLFGGEGEVSPYQIIRGVFVAIA